MNYTLIWSPEAKEQYAILLEYVELNFGLDAALNVLDKTDNVLSKVVLFPFMYPSSEKQNIRKAVVTKQLSLYYRVSQNHVEVLRLIDNRRDDE